MRKFFSFRTAGNFRSEEKDFFFGRRGFFFRREENFLSEENLFSCAKQNISEYKELSLPSK